MTANETVCAVIIRELDRQGITRQQFATRVGHTSAWATLKLTGKRRWSVDDLDQVSRVLEVPVAMLLMAPAQLVGAATQK